MTPAVSIGVPVYNGAGTLRSALDALLAQTFADFEIVISDNASTDDTEAICREYAARDPRIRYIRQPENIGATANFALVLSEASAPLFMWCAADDTRAPNFLEHTVPLVQGDCVSASAVSSFEGSDQLLDFQLDADTPQDRIRQFLRICWKSNGLFYGVHRTDVLRAHALLSEAFLAADWAAIMHMAAHGKVMTTDKTRLILGRNGVSNSLNIWKLYRRHPVEHVIPMLRVSTFVMRLGLPGRFAIGTDLVRLNLQALALKALTPARRLRRKMTTRRPSLPH